MTAGAVAAERTIVAFDYGTNRIGVAIGNTVTRTARPLQILEVANPSHAFLQIGTILGQWRPDRVVVGRPVHDTDANHPVTRSAEKFARRLRGQFGLPVDLVDERYSSLEARSRMRADRQADRLQARMQDGDDSYAAAVILEQYLAELR